MYTDVKVKNCYQIKRFLPLDVIFYNNSHSQMQRNTMLICSQMALRYKTVILLSRVYLENLAFSSRMMISH